MYTLDTALDALKKYNIDEDSLDEWESELALEIPVDAYGRKQYSPHHVNLFKNIKKHIALGRTIQEIKEIITLPPIETSSPILRRNPEILPLPKEKFQTAFIDDATSTTVSSAQPLQTELEKPHRDKEESPHIALDPLVARVTYNQETSEEQEHVPLTSKDSITAAKPLETALDKSAYATVPKVSSDVSRNQQKNANHVVQLVHRLTDEKDQLYKKLMETEKLNSHLYSANNLYNKKVREMTAQIKQLRETYNENEKFQLMEDKAKLHRQLIDAEKLSQYKEEEILHQKLQVEALRQELNDVKNHLSRVQKPFVATLFCGDWMENGKLLEVIYDNFGINIEPERVRMFRIAEAPLRLYGQSASIQTVYQYETNPLWKRDETLTLSYIDDKNLKGEALVEYILDGVPVAKVLYHVHCSRSNR